MQAACAGIGSGPVALGMWRPVGQLFKVNFGYVVNWRLDGDTYIKHFYTHTYKLCIHAYHIYANLKIRPIPGGVPNYPRDVYIRAD